MYPKLTPKYVNYELINRYTMYLGTRYMLSFPQFQYDAYVFNM